MSHNDLSRQRQRRARTALAGASRENRGLTACNGEHASAETSQGAGSQQRKELAGSTSKTSIWAAASIKSPLSYGCTHCHLIDARERSAREARNGWETQAASQRARVAKISRAQRTARSATTSLRNAEIKQTQQIASKLFLIDSSVKQAVWCRSASCPLICGAYRQCCIIAVAGHCADRSHSGPLRFYR